MTPHSPAFAAALADVSALLGPADYKRPRTDSPIVRLRPAHERRTSPLGREAWHCACGATKLLLSAAAMPFAPALLQPKD